MWLVEHLLLCQATPTNRPKVFCTLNCESRKYFNTFYSSVLNFVKYKVHIWHLRLKLPIKQTLNAVCLLDSDPVVHYGNESCLIYFFSSLLCELHILCAEQALCVIRPHGAILLDGTLRLQVLSLCNGCWDCISSSKVPCLSLSRSLSLPMCHLLLRPAAELLPLENCCLCCIFPEREGVRVWEEGGSVVWLYGDVPSGRCGDSV